MTYVCLNSSSSCLCTWSYAFLGPAGLTASVTSNITNLSTVVQWDVVDDSFTTTNYTVTWAIENYTVTWAIENTPIGSATLTEQSSYTITGLTLDTVYTITVTAVNECGQGPEYMTSGSFPSGMYHLHYF